jgi:hypothetical protein
MVMFFTGTCERLGVLDLRIDPHAAMAIYMLAQDSLVEASLMKMIERVRFDVPQR